MNGTHARHENAEKKSITKDPFTPRRPRPCRSAYASPANPPLASPTAEARETSEKPGFTTSIAPRNAPATHSAWRGLMRSPNIAQQASRVKNGAVLLSAIASPIGIAEIA